MFNWAVLADLLISFVSVFLLMKFLPLSRYIIGHDRGRLYAEGSEVNIGKPTGVGFYFIIAFLVIAFIFCSKSIALTVMLVLMAAAMFSGYFDDVSKKAWNEYIKGALDFGIAILGGIFFYVFFGGSVTIALTGYSFEIPAAVYILLAIVLYIVSINALNATDGVDGLSGSLTVISVISMMLLAFINDTLDENGIRMGITLIGVLLAYLMFNHFPSKVLMGDAGSRALGFFVAFYAMYLRIPFSYLIIGLPFMLDGGLSILKITIGRLTHKKIIILKNVVTPIHDHLKKQMKFSVPKTWLTIVSFGLIVDVIYLVISLIIH